jgi:hypothetical protein
MQIKRFGNLELVVIFIRYRRRGLAESVLLRFALPPSIAACVTEPQTPAAGYTAIVNAAFLREEERKLVADTAAQAGILLVGLWLETPEEVLAKRVMSCGRDASDADMTVIQRQLRADTGSISWHRLGASGGLESTWCRSKDHG